MNDRQDYKSIQPNYAPYFLEVRPNHLNSQNIPFEVLGGKYQKLKDIKTQPRYFFVYFSANIPSIDFRSWQFITYFASIIILIVIYPLFCPYASAWLYIFINIPILYFWAGQFSKYFVSPIFSFVFTLIVIY